MSVRCSKCGEQLLGSVNRCWQCGQTFTGNAQTSEVPPIRRQTVAFAGQEVDDFDTAAGNRGTGDRVQSPSYRPVKALYQQKIFRENCAITSVVVGVMTLIGSIFTSWVSLPGTVGIFLGTYGLQSPRRRMALVGISLCCLALMGSATRVLSGLYQSYQQSQQEEWGDF
ncbi:MAG: hypothetical protein P8N76_20280 [Pirellulaceae bacterium]|nr:hypothetical protein [Pirellulaceae bacterium]